MAQVLTGRSVLLSVAVGGLLMSASLFTAPLAYGCPEGEFEDTVTRMCWTQSGAGDNFGFSGDGPCLPGRLGNCLGELQDGSPTSGSQNSAVPCGFGPDSGYPCGYWPDRTGR